MDPVTAFSLAVSIVDAFKETYLIGKFVYRTISSGIHHESERKEIEESFYFELLKLQSFGRWFEKTRGSITHDSDLDRPWLESIAIVFKRLAEDFGEFRSIAEKEDPDYKKFSPLLNPDKRSTGQIEASLKQNLPKVSGPWFFSKLLPDKKLKDSAWVVGSKWALFQKDRLERVVSRFRKRNKRLQEVLPLAIAARLQETDQTNRQKEGMLKDLVEDPDAVQLGLAKHAQIRGLIQGSMADAHPELNLKNTVIISKEEETTIHPAKIRDTKAQGNVVEENVLVEYKYYGLPSLEPLGLVDHKEQSTKLPAKLEERVTELANLLLSSGSNELGTLPLKGYINQAAQGRHVFIFYFPQKTEKSRPLSLQAIITDQKSDPWRLALRFKIAQNLATTLGDLHVDRWIHKNISSQSLVFFRDRQQGNLLENDPYLVGFEYSRPDSGSTMRYSDGDMEKNLYRHPAIQNEERPSFSRLHDLYALGVILLEIAVWQTAHDIVEYGIPDKRNRTSDLITSLYVKLAKKQIPHRMGSSYMKAVLACLTSEFEDQFSRSDFPQTFQKEVVDHLSPKSLLVEVA